MRRKELDRAHVRDYQCCYCVKLNTKECPIFVWTEEKKKTTPSMTDLRVASDFCSRFSRDRMKDKIRREAEEKMKLARADYSQEAKTGPQQDVQKKNKKPKRKDERDYFKRILRASGTDPNQWTTIELDRMMAAAKINMGDAWGDE